MRGRLLAALFPLVLGFVLLEFGLGLITHFDVLPLKVPTYSMQAVWKRSFWGDINPAFGVWHKPDATFRHVRQCFDVVYHANSVGARDRERTKLSPQTRVVVLGDSFMEGWGVVAGKRVSDLLETRTGIEHLNFSSAGDFGPTQYYLLYKTLAKQFAHSAVLVALLPANDFNDDDLDYGKRHHADRYRPYFVGRSPEYRLVYFREALTKSSFREPDGWLTVVKRFLSEFTYTYNGLAYAKGAWVSGERFVPTEPTELPPASVAGQPYSGYFDYTAEQLARLEFILERIREEAVGKTVVVVLLPVPEDVERSTSGVTPPLTQALARFGRDHGIEVVDLLPALQAQRTRIGDLFLTCDGHWSEAGHEAAAAAILSSVSIYRHTPSAGLR